MEFYNSHHDPFLILGIGPSATPEMILQTYLKKGQELHADSVPNDPNAVARFRRMFWA